MMKLEICGLTKSYNEKIALKQVSVTLTPGITALLGPNGAGKSTLMNIITDNVRPDSGKVYYDGTDTIQQGREFRKKVGFMPQQQKMYGGFTVLRFLYYMAALKGMSRKQTDRQVEKLLHEVNLYQERNKKISALSGGMKQRLLIAQAVLDNPEVILLDEPTAGLDPEERIRIRNLVSAISLDRIVLYSTHVVSDIESIAEDVIFLKEGCVAAEGSPDHLIRELKGKVFRTVIPPQELNQLKEKAVVSEIRRQDGNLLVKIISDPLESYKLIPADADLQDYYLSLYGSNDETNRI